MSDITGLQNDESSLRTALTQNNVTAAVEARISLGQDMASFKGGAMDAYDQLAQADAAKHVTPLIMYDSKSDGLSLRPKVDDEYNQLADKHPEVADQVALNRRFVDAHMPTLDNLTRDDAKNMFAPGDGFQVFKQHLRDAHHMLGNRGIDAYIAAMDGQLEKRGDQYRISPGMETTAMSEDLTPGKFGTFVLKGVGKTEGSEIPF